MSPRDCPLWVSGLRTLRHVIIRMRILMFVTERITSKRQRNCTSSHLSSALHPYSVSVGPQIIWKIYMEQTKPPTPVFCNPATGESLRYTMMTDNVSFNVVGHSGVMDVFLDPFFSSDHTTAGEEADDDDITALTQQCTVGVLSPLLAREGYYRRFLFYPFPLITWPFPHSRSFLLPSPPPHNGSHINNATQVVFMDNQGSLNDKDATLPSFENHINSTSSQPSP